MFWGVLDDRIIKESVEVFNQEEHSKRKISFEFNSINGVKNKDTNLNKVQNTVRDGVLKIKQRQDKHKTLIHY